MVVTNIWGFERSSELTITLQEGELLGTFKDEEKGELEIMDRKIFLCFFICLLILFITAGAFAQVEKDDILIADFEGDSYGEWETTGSAFGRSPKWFNAKYPELLRGFQGNGLATSYQNWNEPTGTLTSPYFAIQRDYINFLISGGDDKEKTCMQLIVDGDIVRRKTGEDSNLLDWECWDVAEFKGKKARILIIDNHSGDWGHINVDHIYQSHQKIDILRNVDREFTFNKKYLNLPVKNGAAQRLIRVLIDDKIVREFKISLAPHEPDFWDDLHPIVTVACGAQRQW